MADRLAGLVLPDRTPVEEVVLLPGMEGDRPPPAKRLRWRRPRREKPAREAAPRMARGDWAIVGAGIALAAVCGLFPWYIFFNQEDFGIRPVVFEGADGGFPPPGELSTPQIVGAGSTLPGMAFPELDMEATGTVPDERQKAGTPLSAQPFPGAEPDFKLILVANARAMIEDDDGFWVVQRDSWLPDGSRVASIELRAGSWVLVTSRDAVVPLTGR